MQKPLQHLHAKRRVDHFGMKLHAPDSPLGVFERGHRRIRGGRSRDETVGSGHHRIEMAHPHVLLARQVGEELRRRIGDREPGPPVLAAHAPADLAAGQLLGNELHAVTDAKDWDAQLVDGRIE